MLRLTPPAGCRELLLHACCAPCSCAIVECLLANGLRPTLFFYNPNIYPAEEYALRKAEAVRFCAAQGVPFVDADYDYAAWRAAVKGLEGEPERGSRCSRCFFLRLSAAARYASLHGFAVVATTLAASRWKDLAQVNAAGGAAVAPYEGVTFWAQNWRKGGLQERRNALLKEYAFYNQQYCGCEFSLSSRTPCMARAPEG